jgi:hypothetical protein
MPALYNLKYSGGPAFLGRGDLLHRGALAPIGGQEQLEVVPAGRGLDRFLDGDAPA